MTRREKIARRARRRWLRFAVQFEFAHRKNMGFIKWRWVGGRSYERYHGHPLRVPGETGRIENVRFVCS